MSFNQAKEQIGGIYKSIADSLNDIIHRVKLSKDARILDIGTGDGKMAITLALNGFKVITGEPKDDYSMYAKKNWAENAKKAGVKDLITFKPLRADNLPFGDGFFDGIFMYGTLHHINHIELALRECLRVLKKSGVICIIEPNESMIEAIKKTNPDHPDPVDPTKILKKLPVNFDHVRELNLIGYIIRKI